MSHGQATRSTLTFSRVIHFITVLLVLLFFPVLPARCTPSSAFAPLHAVSYSAAAPSAQFWRGGSARCPGSWFLVWVRTVLSTPPFPQRWGLRPHLPSGPPLHGPAELPCAVGARHRARHRPPRDTT